MKILLDIKQKNRVDSFLELIEGIDYIDVVKIEKEDRKSQFIADMAEAFNDVKLYEQGKKKLKPAKDLLNA